MKDRSKKTTRTNVASGDDVVAVQAGTVDSGESKAPKAKGQAEGRTINVRSGNAKVGVQAEEIAGGISFRWRR